MSKKMKITISFEDKKGRTISKPVEITKNVPWLKEFEELGFEEGFDNLETAILEGRQKATEKATKEYLQIMSKKKFKKNYAE